MSQTLTQLDWLILDLGEVGLDGLYAEGVHAPKALVGCRALGEGIEFKLELCINYFFQSAQAEVSTLSLSVEVGSIQCVAS